MYEYIDSIFNVLMEHTRHIITICQLAVKVFAPTVRSTFHGMCVLRDFRDGTTLGLGPNFRKILRLSYDNLMIFVQYTLILNKFTTLPQSYEHS